MFGQNECYSQTCQILSDFDFSSTIKLILESKLIFCLSWDIFVVFVRGTQLNLQPFKVGQFLVAIPV